MNGPTSPYRGHRFPGEIISQVVWLYLRLSVSYRDVDEMMAMRGVQLTYETVREWCGKFGSGRKPRVIVTDKLRNYGAARRSVLPAAVHRQSRYLNNRA